MVYLYTTMHRLYKMTSLLSSFKYRKVNYLKIAGWLNFSSTSKNIIINKSLRNNSYTINYLSELQTFRIFSSLRVSEYADSEKEMTLKDESNNEGNESVFVSGLDKENNFKIFQELSKGDPEVLKKLQVFEMKIETCIYKLGIIPKIEKDHWYLLMQSTDRQAKKIIAHLFRCAIREAKKTETVASSPRPTLEYDPDDLSYSLFQNSLFLRVRDRSLKKIANSRAFRAVLHSEEIFIDCSYEDYMGYTDIRSLGKQISLMLTLNINHINPYKIVFCNFDRNSALGQCISKYSATFYEKENPIILYEGSYLDLCPKNKLVYLTPHCNTYMESINPYKRYVIGAFVDKNIPKPISLAKAKELNLAMAKFPLEKHLIWGIGKKTLTLNNTLQIMLDLRVFQNNWKKAFQSIPKRFLLTPEERKKFAEFRKESKRYCTLSQAMDEIF